MIKPRLLRGAVFATDGSGETVIGNVPFVRYSWKKKTPERGFLADE